jgi:monofunctional biosynthetic peptidoglycan transglycosylase
MARAKGLFARFFRFLRWAIRIGLVLLVVDLAYLAWIWPDWARYDRWPTPKSRFIQHYEEQQSAHPDWPVLRWAPVPIGSIPLVVQRAAIVAEDSRFYQHQGFDLAAIRDAFNYNLVRGRIVRGASTISQQTAKNLFLSPARDPLRKWHEIFLTWGLEQNLSKQRILELYLNSVEFGRGIYGVQAAALAYWGIPASDLNLVQAAELAATLPSPVKNNPAQRNDFFNRHSQKILTYLTQVYDRRPGSAPPPEGIFDIWSQ